MPESGGTSPTSDRNHNVRAIYGGREISAAINSNGQVLRSVDGNNPLPDHIAALTDIVAIKVAEYGYDSGSNSYLALRANNQVVQWTDGAPRDDFPKDIAERKDFVAIQTTEYAFAGITQNGHVIAWGWCIRRRVADSFKKLTMLSHYTVILVHLWRSGLQAIFLHGEVLNTVLIYQTI